MTVSAEAAARPAVGRHLNEAIHQAGAGNVSAARASVASAEGVGGLTPGDRAAIDQVKSYIAQKSGSAGGGGCAGLYLKGDYRGVIASGGGDAQCTTLKAQSYYLLHDYAGCVRYIRDNMGSGAGENTLVMQQRCAYESQDNEGQRQALELLVQRTNKPQYWKQLLETAQGTKGLSDHGTLDIYRLKLMTGSLVKAEDYSLLAQLALQLGFAAESASVIQKATVAKVQMGGRTGALLAMANGQAASNAAKARPGRGRRATATRWSSWAKTPGARAASPTPSSSSRPASPRARATRPTPRSVSAWRCSAPARRPRRSAPSSRSTTPNRRSSPMSGKSTPARTELRVMEIGKGRAEEPGLFPPCFGGFRNNGGDTASSRAAPCAWSTDRCAHRCRAALRQPVPGTRAFRLASEKFICTS